MFLLRKLSPEKYNFHSSTAVLSHRPKIDILGDRAPCLQKSVGIQVAPFSFFKRLNLARFCSA